MGQPTRIIDCPACGEFRQLHARGLCNPCYSRLHRQGGLAKVAPYSRRYKTAEEWYAMIDKSDPEACWQWPGPLNSHGYGATYPDHVAHRWVYRTLVGPIPQGMVLDHNCHNKTGCNLRELCPHRACVNLRHLDVVTVLENLSRSPNTATGRSLRGRPGLRNSRIRGD